MSEYFPNAPLIELIAEFRWSVEPQEETEPDQVDALSGLTGDDETELFYKKMRQGLAERGFGQSERLVPNGFPASPGQAVYRCRSSDEESSAVIFHFGPGVFSVNAIPPYKSWDHFRPAVETGLLVLLASGQPAATDPAFTRIALRYIDAFSDDYLEGGNRYDFLTKTLGFGIGVPSVIAGLSDESSEPKMFLQFSAPLKTGSELAIKAGEATVSNAKAVVLDIAVAHNQRTVATIESSFAILDEAHHAVNAIFVGITEPVAHILRMEPQ